MLRALSAFATAALEARSHRRTSSIISNLPESVQKDIGWRWTSPKSSNAPRVNWELM